MFRILSLKDDPQAVVVGGTSLWCHWNDEEKRELLTNGPYFSYFQVSEMF